MLSHGIYLHTHVRSFATTPTARLLYKRATKVKKAPVVATNPDQTHIDPSNPSNPSNSSPTPPQLASKYYQRAPAFLKPHMRCVLLHPTGFVVAVAALQQLLTIGPFLATWFALYKYGSLESATHLADKMPEILIDRGQQIVASALNNTLLPDATTVDVDIPTTVDNIDIPKATTTGAVSYAIVKASAPLVWAFALVFAPAFHSGVLQKLVAGGAALKSRIAARFATHNPTL